MNCISNAIDHLINILDVTINILLLIGMLTSKINFATHVASLFFPSNVVLFLELWIQYFICFSSVLRII